MFNLTPVGKFHVQFCGTTPCRLRGADDIEKVCHARIGEQNHVTADGKSSSGSEAGSAAASTIPGGWRASIITKT